MMKIDARWVLGLCVLSAFIGHLIGEREERARLTAWDNVVTMESLEAFRPLSYPHPTGRDPAAGEPPVLYGNTLATGSWCFAGGVWWKARTDDSDYKCRMADKP